MSLDFLCIENDSVMTGEWRFVEYEEDLITGSIDESEYLIIRQPLLEKLTTLDSDIYRLNSLYGCNISGVARISEDDYYRVLEQSSVNKKRLNLTDNSEIQNALEGILLSAVNLGASDLHITRNDNIAQIELRVNGVLSTFMQMKADKCDELVFVLYNVEANTKDTTWNRAIPQSANILYTLANRNYRFRYAHFPIFGESAGCYHAVLRIIASGIQKAAVASLDKLGVSDDELSDIKKILSNPYGAYIIAGTTGSGKSTTLKNLMEWLQINRYDDKGCFLTVEDPVEYQIYGAKQSSVLNADGGGFHMAIKSALRRDPDVLMVGEIRDNISANALAGAVESGHYCFTTVHAGNIVSLLQRLSALGITSDKLSTPGFVAGLQCQKLIPVICDHCKESKSITILDKKFSVFTRHHDGCPKCKFTGISGRQLVLEYMRPGYDELEAISKQEWLRVYTIWRAKRKMMPSLSEGFEIKEKVMAKVLLGKVCSAWFDMEFGSLENEALEVILEKIQQV
ncbi:pilus assembly protein [Rahnella sp. AA]|nr:ATPase, T2SS/T4P/T4SS family [Rahnella sp. AA]PKE31865.1 pilus assembly protein [Rahnella sp. AA]